MSTGTIIVDDNGDGTVNIKIEFGDEGVNESSPAHGVVADMLHMYVERRKEEQE